MWCIFLPSSLSLSCECFCFCHMDRLYISQHIGDSSYRAGTTVLNSDMVQKCLQWLLEGLASCPEALMVSFGRAVEWVGEGTFVTCITGLCPRLRVWGKTKFDKNNNNKKKHNFQAKILTNVPQQQVKKKINKNCLFLITANGWSSAPLKRKSKGVGASGGKKQLMFRCGRHYGRKCIWTRVEAWQEEIRGAEQGQCPFAKETAFSDLSPAPLGRVLQGSSPLCSWCWSTR